ncbi:MAG: hypothetical protein H0U57_01160 [Tatlockia sp.]|nr:hypothetical protein [Tatlockia sp.]
MKKTNNQDHPEVSDIKNICDISPNTEETKEICKTLKKEKNKPKKEIKPQAS